jgi:hypothetical protein
VRDKLRSEREREEERSEQARGEQSQTSLKYAKGETTQVYAESPHKMFQESDRRAVATREESTADPAPYTGATDDAA